MYPTINITEIISEDTYFELLDEYIHRPLIRTLLQIACPYLGTLIDLSLTDKYSQMIAARLRHFFDELEAGEVDLTNDLIESNEFLHCYMSTVRTVTRTYQKKKISLFARLLNSSAGTRSDTQNAVDEYEEYLSIIDALSEREWHLLNIIYLAELSVQREQNETPLQHAKKYWAEMIQTIEAKGLSSKDELPAFLARLNRTGCYITITGSFLSYGGDVGHTTATYKKLRQLVQKK